MYGIKENMPSTAVLTSYTSYCFLTRIPVTICCSNKPISTLVKGLIIRPTKVSNQRFKNKYLSNYTGRSCMMHILLSGNRNSCICIIFRCKTLEVVTIQITILLSTVINYIHSWRWYNANYNNRHFKRHDARPVD